MEVQCFLWGKSWLLKCLSSFYDLPSIHRIFWFSSVFEQMLRWFASFPFATTRFSYSPPSHLRFKFIKIKPLALEAPKLCNSYRIQSSNRGYEEFCQDYALSACFLVVSCFVDLQPWRWRRHIPLKRRLTFNWLHGVIFRKIEACKELLVNQKIKIPWPLSTCCLTWI
jgi:hypothetical protein